MNYACLIVKIVKEPEQQFFGYDLKLTMTESIMKCCYGQPTNGFDMACDSFT